MNQIGSLVPMNAQAVADACRTTIAAIEAWRRGYDSEFVARRLRKWNGRWWRRLFRMRELTKADVDAEFADPMESWCAGYPSRRYGYSLDVARRLLDAVSESESETVYVSPEDWACLG